MKKIARLFFHLSRNALIGKYRYFHLSPNEKGAIHFYDRRLKNVFSVKSRGLIDSVTANQIYSNDEYNFHFIGRHEQVHRMYTDILAARKIPLIIDCGANIGLSSQYFAREFPEARILGVEPDAANIAMAKRNCAEFGNIELHHAAIGSEEGFVAIEDATVDANAFRVNRVDEGVGIELRTIPGLLAESRETELFIVKVDIEGFERDLFESATDWIEKCDVLIVELHDWMLPNEASSGNFIRAVGAYDRDFLFRGENVFSIRNAS